jgi:hypothetical protein
VHPRCERVPNINLLLPALPPGGRSKILSSLHLKLLRTLFGTTLYCWNTSTKNLFSTLGFSMDLRVVSMPLCSLSIDRFRIFLFH